MRVIQRKCQLYLHIPRIIIIFAFKYKLVFGDASRERGDPLIMLP